MDQGAWQATVHGVAKTKTRLSNYTDYYNKFKRFFVFFFSICPPPSLTFSHEARLSIQEPRILVSLAAAILTFWLKRGVVVHQVAESPKH